MVTRQQPFGRSLATAAVWPFGVSLTCWNYLWRTTPLHRRERAGSPEEDTGPALPPGISQEGLQPADAGVGPLYHRRYRVSICDAQLDPEELLERIAADPNAVAPTEFARFTKVHGDKGQMRVGDEYIVRMPGPWNGPVRVVALTSTSFRLATLQGHLEAGQVEFRTTSNGDLACTIESWARSGDQLSRVLYQNLRMAKEVQLHMWTSVLERAADLSEGRIRGGIDIETHRVDVDASESHRVGDPRVGDPRLDDPTAKQMLDDLHDKALNFVVGERDQFAPRDGWKIDEYRQALPSEPPGEPVPGGSWEIARDLVRNYEFADPTIVRTVYHPESALEDRDMLLEVRFYGLRFRFGVRVGGVRDETCEVDGRLVRVWGWNYRTLQGHLEMGQMDYEVWKWLDTGTVEFRTCRFSRRAGVGNPAVRLGLRLFGRWQQVKFARRACERMARLTEAALEGKEGSGGVPRVADLLHVSASSARQASGKVVTTDENGSGHGAFYKRS